MANETAKAIRVQTCLWFNGKVGEAAELYTSLVPGSKILGGMGKGNDALTVTLSLGGHELMLLNGGPHYTLNEAASIVLQCDGQAEVDRLWSALLAGGGKESRCGWLKDRFGVSWQIVPTQFLAMAQGKDPAKSKRVMDAMMTMVKLDVAALKKAYDGG